MCDSLNGWISEWIKEWKTKHMSEQMNTEYCKWMTEMNYFLVEPVEPSIP
jgi:hypothetical protein